MFSIVNILALMIIAVSSYLIGAVNASIIVTKLFDNGSDIREVGSGNAGFTNVLRTKGKKLAVFTFLIDFTKGVFALGLAQVIMIHLCGFQPGSSQFCIGNYVSCLCCVLGHMYPCFFGFRGGKSILTAWATTLLIDWKIFLILISIFVIVLIFTKIVSVASIAAAVTFPISVWLTTYVMKSSASWDIFTVSMVISLFISVMIIYKHRKNISRILNGEEKKLTIHK